MRLAVSLALLMVLAGCGPTIAPSAAVSPGSTPTSIASGPRISAPPVAPPAPPGNDLPPFACSDASGGTTGVANTIAARVDEAAGYDRFVLQMDSIVPTFTVKRQAKPVFSAGASGQTLTLVGTAGVLVQVHSATGTATFTGPTDIVHPDFKVLQEARQTEDFEGYVSWGLGLSAPACMRVFTLADPARLVVDFERPTS
ncbi:MAG: AMIN-like domain-containing (lipo)protein [Candidatus Limnocylindria bacterium]